MRPCRDTVEKFLDHLVTQVIIILVTIYALTGEDFRLLFFGIEADNIFMYLNIVTFIIFSLELVFACFSKKEYCNSFFFWLDFISALSILTDIEPVWAAIVGEANSAENQENQTDAMQLIRAARGARIGTRAGRMARAVRLIRLVRIAKLYK